MKPQILPSTLPTVAGSDQRGKAHWRCFRRRSITEEEGGWGSINPLPVEEGGLGEGACVVAGIDPSPGEEGGWGKGRW